MTRLPAFVVLAGALAGYAFWVYLRAELPLRGARRLASLRAASLLLLLALAFDVRVPWGGTVRAPERWALLDVSASMAAAGGAAWASARAEAQTLEADGWRVVPFGDGLLGNGAGDPVPGAHTSELAPALVRAAEAGVAEVRVLSDLRLQDPVASSSALVSLPVSVSFEGFGADIVNAGAGDFVVRDQRRRGEGVGAQVVFFAEGVSDSLQVEVREEGTLVASVTVGPPSPGRRGYANLELPPPRGEGRLRYTVRVHVGGDAFRDDDEAVAYMNAGHEAGGLVVVSLRPDWEPRALLGVLAESTGLLPSGYLRVGPDRFVPMGRGLPRGTPVDSATVREAADDAAMLVLHGLDARTDGWGRALARRTGRLLLWPLDAGGAGVARAPAGAPLAGEWYAAADVPSSPVAGDLAGTGFRDLPPLEGLLPLDRGVSPVAALLVQLGGTGPAAPGIVLEQGNGGRRAVVLASGFWRWAARDGPPRDAYRRLWSGVAGWLLAGDPLAGGLEVRPEAWVNPPGEGIAWRIPGEEGETVRLEVLDDGGRAVADTVLPTGGSALLPPLAPGTYRYRAEGPDQVLGEGRFDVERGSEEMLPRPWTPDVVGVVEARGQGPGSRGRPLRTSPWPYLLLLLLLSVEWVGRRRAGLR